MLGLRNVLVPPDKKGRPDVKRLHRKPFGGVKAKEEMPWPWVYQHPVSRTLFYLFHELEAGLRPCF